MAARLRNANPSLGIAIIEPSEKHYYQPLWTLVGGGIVLDGRLLDGDSGNAGHIGHVVVTDGGRPLPDHVTGVLEAEASGTALAHHHGRPAAELGDEVRAETGRLVGRAVGSVVNLLDLRLVRRAPTEHLDFVLARLA